MKQPWQIEYDRFIDEMKIGLGAISGERYQLTFGVGCCQRMLPSYATFQRNAQWGNFQFLYNLCQLLWKECKTISLEVDDVRVILQGINTASADSESTYKGKPIEYIEIAQNVCSVFDQVLKFIVQKDYAFLQLAAETTLWHFKTKTYFRLRENTKHLVILDQGLERFESDLLDEKVWNEATVQEELARQRNDLALLITLSRNKDENRLCEFITAGAHIRMDSLGQSFDEGDI